MLKKTNTCTMPLSKRVKFQYLKEIWGCIHTEKRRKCYKTKNAPFWHFLCQTQLAVHHWHLLSPLSCGEFQVLFWHIVLRISSIIPYYSFTGHLPPPSLFSTGLGEETARICVVCSIGLTVASMYTALHVSRTYAGNDSQHTNTAVVF